MNSGLERCDSENGYFAVFQIPLSHLLEACGLFCVPLKEKLQALAIKILRARSFFSGRSQMMVWGNNIGCGSAYPNRKLCFHLYLLSPFTIFARKIYLFDLLLFEYFLF